MSALTSTPFLTVLAAKAARFGEYWRNELFSSNPSQLPIKPA
ncbi:hypothetical protein OKW45_005521 [Paraburkholderia sp. WSM4175]